MTKRVVPQNCAMSKEFLTRDELIEQESTGLLAGSGNAQVELRQRQRVGSSGSTFSNPASRDSEDDDDEIERPRKWPGGGQFVAMQPLASNSSGCPMACFFFSVAGVIFLSIIASLLGSNSLYLRVGKDNTNDKTKLAEGVRGAVLMYAGCALVSGWIWWRQRSASLSVHVAVD